ncbi:MAG: protein-L-isoaspartate(D-aspartate) O-methyltransferase [Gammaproteobacteria bacterium]
MPHSFSIRLGAIWLGLGLSLTLAHAQGPDPYAPERGRLIAEIEREFHWTASMIGQTAPDARVLEVMGQVPRHRFVADDYADDAYRNEPLPIGHGQTISQPYIVALMSDLLDLPPEARVLEIGTGSGYQAAVLAGLAKAVYSIEIIEPLGRMAAERLVQLGYTNVETRIGDGYYGWVEHAPFDGIMVTAAADHIPPPLAAQLKPGGRLIMPVGGPFLTQHLVLVEKGQDGRLSTRQLLPVRFVPLTGGH